MMILSWNLFHGRSLPPTRHSLLDQFAAHLVRWSWDVALLQEVPPWWPGSLARAAAADHRSALTSRNSLLVLRRAVAKRDPELAKSNGGGCNAILSRTPIVEHAALRLRAWPERRVAQARAPGRRDVRGELPRQHTRAACRGRAATAVGARAAAGRAQPRLVLGGDLNLRTPLAPNRAIAHVAARDVDHIFLRGLVAAGVETLDRHVVVDGASVELSDHPPLRVRAAAAVGGPA